MTYIRIMWMLSMMGFLVVLLYMHVYLPDLLQLDAQGDGRADYTFGKNLLFYGSLAVLLIVNGSLLAFSKIFTFLPVQAIPVPRRDVWTTDSYMRTRMEKNFRSWMKGLMLVINMLLMIFLLNLYSMFDEFATYTTAWMYGVVTVLMLGWIAFYFVLFNRPEMTED